LKTAIAAGEDSPAAIALVSVNEIGLIVVAVIVVIVVVFVGGGEGDAAQDLGETGLADDGELLGGGLRGVGVG
jgi:hypothetical protein